MSSLKRQYKNLLKLIFVAVLIAAITVGFRAGKENGSSQVVVSQDLNLPNTANNGATAKSVCKTLLEEENENSIVISEYDVKNKVECVFVGCGGLF